MAVHKPAALPGARQLPAPGTWWRSLPASVKAAFFSCFVAGFLAHLFAFTNIIPNSDGISRVYDSQEMTISGRWFLHWASAWNGYIQAPAVIGFFSVLFLSLSAALTVSMLKLESPILGGLTGALMVVFPSMAYTYLYLFTASAYCFGILLAVTAVWLTERYRFGWLFGVPLLACAIGTYQAYLAVAASLVLICLVLRGLSGDAAAKELFFGALRRLGLLVLGLGLYYGMLRLMLRIRHLTLLNYKGISSFGSDLTLKSLLTTAGQAYRGFFSYFFRVRGFASYTTGFAVALHVLLAAAGLWAVIRLLARNRRALRPGTLVLTLVFCCLLPIALNLTVFMGDPMPIMRYALVFAYVLALTLVDRAAALPAPAAKRKSPAEAGQLPRWIRAAAAAVGALLCVVSFQIDNLAYTAAAQAHRATESFATRLVERVESTPGYVNGMQVAVIGGFPTRVYHSQIEAYALIEDYSAPSSTVLPLNKHIYYYMNDWLNVTWPEPDEATLKAISDSELFQSMPLYPSDGSVIISDGRVIVRLAARYRPKQDYEIAYEQQRKK